MKPRVNINAEVTIVTLIHTTANSAGVSSLHPGDVLEVRNFGNCTAKIKILRGNNYLRFGVKSSSQTAKIDLAINMTNHEELDVFNHQSKITEDFIIETLISLFPDLWFRGELLPESNSYLVKYKIFDVMQVQKPVDTLTL